MVSGTITKTISVTLSLASNGVSALKSLLGLAGGGIVTPWHIQAFASGGTISKRVWNALPKYGSGTSGIHGSLFVAGESGSELVGHVNGTTEVLNRFQLAAVMKDAIISGMSLFEGYWRTMNSLQVTCANGIINSVLVGAEALINTTENVNSYDPTNTLADSIYANAQRGLDFSEEAMAKVMGNFYQEYVEPTLKEIASDTKRQADKDEQTIVKIGNRTINDAIVTQQKANGYSFAT